MDYYHTTTFEVPLELLDSVRAWAMVLDNQCQLLTAQLGDQVAYSVVIHDVEHHTDRAREFSEQFGLTARTQ